ncbi:MAG: HlyD family efflux transporter periplasmic adaptor subunit [Eubacterium sp.]|nr:HlyD family efflux transporter periplasmic adaptor subunit [Eubacterium sp.]MBQ9022341.1 HlyD family efflux transporter periplasmic adaptor subunit [Eubacterium sp.]
MGKNKNNQSNDTSGKKKKKIIIIIVVIAAAAIAAFAAFHIHQKKMADSIMPTVATDQVSRKTLTSSIAATGTIKSKTVTDVTAAGVGETGLKVTGVNVKVGDVVSEGDVLCTFDVSSAKEQLADVKDAQAKAEAAEAQSKKSAQRAYDNAVSSKDTQLEAAQAEIDAASANVTQAKNELAALPGEIEDARAAVEEAQRLYAEAQAKVVDADEASQKAADAAKADLDAAKDGLKELTDPKYEQTLKDAVTSAEAAYRQACAAYQTTSDSADEAIASAKDALDTANLGSDSSDSTTKAQIRSLQEAIDGESLKSPVSGTVTAVNVKEDGIYTGGAVVTIQDTNDLYVEASIKESDIADVKEGMEVLVKTDATGDEELTGKVTGVAPTAGSSVSLPTDSAESMMSGAATSSGSGYLVEIDLLEKNERLRIDMTAKLSLIKEQKKNILVVPYDAIFTDENGNKTLHVVSEPAGEDGLSVSEEALATEALDGYEEVRVETGMESGYYVEILPTPGIENGTVILLPEADENSLDEMDPAGGLG